jgi:GNAT superfamily N-acetyltransferase
MSNSGVKPVSKMIHVVKATPEDLPRVAEFYQSCGYKHAVGPGDEVFIAKLGGQLVGCGRISLEFGTRVLRGMQVETAHQRAGVGNRILNELVSRVGRHECYCVPYRYLTKFYGLAGFREIPLEQAPSDLRDRVASYISSGVDVIVMKKDAL